MHLPAMMLSSLLLALAAVRANPLNRDTGKTTLSISTKINTDGVGSFVEKDRARVQSLMKSMQLSTNNSVPTDVSSNAMSYTVEVGVGTPPTYYTLLVDTGSANTWIGAVQTYKPVNSSVNTGNSVYMRYGSGAFSGEEWLDTLTLTPDMVIKNQSIGVANWTAGINGVFDGILGLGPIDLTKPSVNNTLEVPTVMDNLYSQGKISQEVIGIFFSPAAESDNHGGLTFGGYDSSVLKSAVNYVPLTKTTPAAHYWGINQTIAYGNTTIMPTSAGIVDSGTTLIYMASDAIQKYQSLTGATLDYENTGFLTISAAQFANLQTLTLNIGGTPYSLTPNAQIWPRSLNAIIGGDPGAIYLVINDIGHPSGTGFDFCNGYSFLQRYYSVFDTTNQRIGFAETNYTNSTSN